MMKNQNDEKNHDESSEIKELIQQKIILKEIVSHLEENIRQLEETGEKEEDVQKINELEQQKILLNELNRMMSENNASVDEIFTILSHEFKTPMVPIKAYADILLEGNLGELTESQKEKLKIVQSSISSLHDLVSNSLDSKKMELGQITMDKTETNLTKLICGVIEKTSEVKNSILFYPPNENITVLCDAARISQVLVNLIKNSLKVITKEAGKITIGLKSVNNEAVVTVKDNGIGISPDKLPRMFSKYGKTDISETRDDPGIGLGLYLCKQIIDSHDGKIWIESEVGKGTTVSFILPIISSRSIESEPFNEKNSHSRTRNKFDKF